MSNATFRFIRINPFLWPDRLQLGPLRLNATAPWHHLPDEQATTALGAALAGKVMRGEAICLWGPLGSGKSTLARGLIRALTRPDEDVPSPTFTLVQQYDHLSPPLWHFDLYRLTDPAEVVELGWEEAVQDCALVEWPDRLGRLTPPQAIRLAFVPEGEGRRVEVTAPQHPELIADARRDWGHR